jgi:hypothetical protein
MLDRFASEQMIGLTSECVIDMPRNIQAELLRFRSLSGLCSRTSAFHEKRENTLGTKKERHCRNQNPVLASALRGNYTTSQRQQIQSDVEKAQWVSPGDQKRRTEERHT